MALIFLTPQEVFDLGNAFGSFSVGEIDQGIHIVLPVTDIETGEKSNECFASLFEDYIDNINASSTSAVDGDPYLQAIRLWLREHVPLIEP